MNVIVFPQRPQRAPLTALTPPCAITPAEHRSRRFTAALEALRTEHELTVAESAQLAAIIVRIAGVTA